MSVCVVTPNSHLVVSKRLIWKVDCGITVGRAGVCLLWEKGYKTLSDYLAEEYKEIESGYRRKTEDMEVLYDGA